MDFVSDIVTWLLAEVGLNKDEVKAFAFSVGLGGVWEAFRGSLLSPIAIVGAAICLTLERLIRVQRRARLVTASMALDYLYPLLDAVLFTGLIAGALAAWVTSLYQQHLPFFQLDLLAGLPLWLQGICVFIVIDFVFYWSHYLHHKVPLFWYLHAVHHSQEDLNPFTVYRGHFLEGVTKAFVRTAPFMVFGGSPTTVFWFTFLNSFWGLFIHSNVRINLGPLKYVLVTPQYHRVHHSVEERHFDMNYGERLTLWDWMFGTMWMGFDDYPNTGVKGFPIPQESERGVPGLVKSWWRLTMYPFYRIRLALVRWTK